ncbi:MAG TPA: winged helix-turn-helix domain-containing protein [Bradyrhizobium sp.]|nr:winged helix-turn-helix domain-containing protein [Bradyrhizobium sp.]
MAAPLQRRRPRGGAVSAHGGPSPLCPEIQAALGAAVCAAQREAAGPPVAGADPKPRWTLKRLVGFVRARFARLCCRETIRAALHRLGLSWKKAKKLLGRADPARREAFIARLRPVLAAAQRDRHQLVYLDEAHIHQDADLGYGSRGCTHLGVPDWLLLTAEASRRAQGYAAVHGI